MEWTRNRYRISDDKSELDLFWVVPAIQDSYWASGRSREVIEQSIANSLTLGLYADGRQIGFARAVTDKCTFAWVCDVMVHQDYRHIGLGKWLMDCLGEHPDMADVAEQFLRTRDAHGLYEQYGYRVCDAMVRNREQA
ncbi:MAG: GNAT family N-acetyltransferase [bacterium]|nr:GNAT family N-acetyltransferase [bacterium]